METHAVSDSYLPRIAGFVLLFICAVTRVQSDENWPDFRGPTHDGRSDATGLPIEWSEQKNIKWKTAIHDKGWSTPAIQDGRIWMTTATEEGTEYFAVCVDRETGAILHDLKLFEAADPEPLGNDVNGYASPSPAAEAGRVYIHFGTYGTACLDSETGETIWTREDIHCRHFRGPGSSVFIYKDLLILTFDGIDVQFLIALDKKTGRTVWETHRTTDFLDLDEHGEPIAEGDFRKAYSTPIVIEEDGGQLLISIGSRAGFAYDPMTGREIWTVRYEGFSSASRPLHFRGMVLLNTGYSPTELWGVRTDGTGDITDTNVVWKYGKGVPHRASPVLVDGLVYLVADNGIAACIEASTGREVWRERLGGQFTASPIHADGRLYFFDERGRSIVLARGREFRVLRENRLDDGMMASPAVSGRSLIVRTKTHRVLLHTRHLFALIVAQIIQSIVISWSARRQALIPKLRFHLVKLSLHLRRGQRHLTVVLSLGKSRIVACILNPTLDILWGVFA